MRVDKRLILVFITVLDGFMRSERTRMRFLSF